MTRYWCRNYKLLNIYSADSPQNGLSLLQTGLPLLPESGSPEHFDILRAWLKDCDNCHISCQPQEEFADGPARLLDVGGSGDLSKVYLIETSPDVSYEYIALSHPWGQGPFFCTYPDNNATHQRRARTLKAHKGGIPMSDLPATFYDAVLVTRSLGVRYLWIDSLCILQGPGGDFMHQSQRMGDIFGMAYCVIAATMANSQHDGFLRRAGNIQRGRTDRQVVKYQKGEADPLYICTSIDDFDKDVLEAYMSKRGWVFQERVLARRTIFFAGSQTYWECGEGIRCETLTKMNK